MANKLFLALVSQLLIGAFAFAAEESAQSPKIVITETSIKVGDVELRSGPPHSKFHFMSGAAVKKAFGEKAERYEAGRVVDYARTKIGIHVQEGIRGEENGKLFKFQVYLENDRDPRTEKDSGKFSGKVQVEGVNVAAATTWESIRDSLKAKGYKITEQPDLSYAEKTGPWGQITIFTAGSSGKIGRVEVWCL